MAKDIPIRASANLQIKDILLGGAVLTSRTLALRYPDTSMHSERVAEYAVKLAKKAKIFDGQLEYIRIGGLLHDCGKISIPDNTLLKPSRLTLAEFASIREHPKIGSDIIKEFLTGLGIFRGISLIIYNCILYHHEAYDGSGYPFGLEGEDIPLEARVLAIADQFDACTNPRPYRPIGMNPYEALKEMKAQSRKYDPMLFGIFCDRVFPEIASGFK